MRGLSLENEKGGFLITMKVIVMIMRARKKKCDDENMIKVKVVFYDDVDNLSWSLHKIKDTNV